jgi:choline dehydrogenase-like flavoprotein
VLAAKAVLGDLLAHAAVNYVVTVPGMWGAGAAFAAEIAISFVLMTTVLIASNSARFMRYTPYFAGVLVAFYIVVEAPVSGMSMNPARTFASAIVAGNWTAWWVYFIAPTAAMLAAAEIFVRARGIKSVLCAKLDHSGKARCIFRCGMASRSSKEVFTQSSQSTQNREIMINGYYDVIIIGTGAGGGTLARKLAPSGKRILILERGDFVKREPDNWNSRAVNVEGKYNTKETWYDADGKPLHPHTNYNVGGNTKFYGAALFRMRERDFGELQHFDGVSPAWPISYDEMEPYYRQAEDLYHVHGTRGEDPTEPWASSDFPYPAVSHEPRIKHLAEDFAAMGVRPFHVPLGIQLNENDRKSACVRCATCDGFPCLIGAKSDAHVCGIEPSLEFPNVTLLTNAMVTRLETDASGKNISSVNVNRNGVDEKYSGDVVVVSCGAINSAALLLRSANDHHPNGLANGSDQVGRNYMGHVNSVMLAVSKCPNPTVFQKTLGVNDFYFGSDDWPYPMGHISFVGKLDGVTLSAGAPAIAPGFTLDLMAKHSLDFWLTTEDLPRPENRVTLNKDGAIVLSYKPNNLEAHKRLQDKLKSLMNNQRKCDTHGGECHQGIFARNLYLAEQIPLAGVAHQNGTIRFGKDPALSVLDVNCKAHELDNLYVVDGSFFPSSSAVNPALTIMANALRVGDHLLERSV